MGATAALAVGVGLVLGGSWAVRHQHHSSSAASAEDCRVVAQLAQLWRADSARSMDSLASDDSDPPAEADGTAALSEKVRSAAQSVTDPAIKQNLASWADGFALLAQIIRSDAQRSTPTEPTAESERISQAGDRIYLTADKLRTACPEAFPPRP